MTNLTWFVSFISNLLWSFIVLILVISQIMCDTLALRFSKKTLQLTKSIDTSSALARKGLDIQGIPWDKLNITREKYRLTRLEQYKNYENIPSSGAAVDKVGIVI